MSYEDEEWDWEPLLQSVENRRETAYNRTITKGTINNSEKALALLRFVFARNLAKILRFARCGWIFFEIEGGCDCGVFWMPLSLRRRLYHLNECVFGRRSTESRCTAKRHTNIQKLEL